MGSPEPVVLLQFDPRVALHLLLFGIAAPISVLALGLVALVSFHSREIVPAAISVRDYGCMRTELHALARALHDRLNWSVIACDRTEVWAALTEATTLRQMHPDRARILRLGFAFGTWGRVMDAVEGTPAYAAYVLLAGELASAQEMFREAREFNEF